MGGGAADEGQAPSSGTEEHGRHEMASLPIPDELLVDIFLRLPAAADLARASAACVSFRRVAADRSFLRRYRKLHAPPLLGFLEYQSKVFHPATPPHHSGPEASAAALAADFSFSFLPGPAERWCVQDIRDGRVLLGRCPKNSDNTYDVVFTELVVCDPLHRRHLLLPPIPAHLRAMVGKPRWIKCLRYYETFLVSPYSDGDQELSAAKETSFSVIWMGQSRNMLTAFVFSSSTRQWRAISSQSWSDLLADSASVDLLSRRQYAYDCFYWVTDWKQKLLVLDTRRMEFSILEPPPEAIGLRGKDISIAEAAEGMLGMFVRSPRTSHLNYSIRRNNCGSSSQWQFEKTVVLNFLYHVMCSTGRHLFLYKWGIPAAHNSGCFSLDVKTFQLERVFVSDSCMHECDGHVYSNFPPSLLSTPTILSGFEEVAEKDVLEQGSAASSSAESPRPLVQC